MKCHNTWLHQYAYLPVWVYKTSGNNKTGYYMITPQAYLANHDSFGFSAVIEQGLKEFFEDTRAHMKEVTEMSGPEW